MDLEHIKRLIEEGKFYTTKEFNKRQDQRGFTLKQVCEMILTTGQIVRIKRRVGPYPEFTIKGSVGRKVGGITIIDELSVACAAGEEIVFITGYWERERRKNR